MGTLSILVSWRMDEQDCKKMTSKLLGGSICRGDPLTFANMLTSSLGEETLAPDELPKLAERGLSRRMLFVSTCAVGVPPPLFILLALDNSATDDDEDKREAEK